MKLALVCGSVEAVLSRVPDNSADAIFSDPPYGLSFMGKKWDYDLPSTEACAHLFRTLKPGAHGLFFGGTRTFHRLACRLEDAGFEVRDCLSWLYATGFPKSHNLGEGYGTALKPAWEPILLVRKRPEGTTEANFSERGTGGLAIDASRIATDWSDRSEAWKRSGHSAKPEAEKIAAPPGVGIVCHELGRWPANLLLDEGSGKLLGEPSRFFFSAKVSTKEREAGCEALPLLSAGEVTDREEGSQGLSSPRAGAGRGRGARNSHPTLKPLSLARYLATLLRTPHPGTILVPYAGAASEMIGAGQAGWTSVLGIESEESHCRIAAARIRHWLPESSLSYANFAKS